MRAPLCSSLFLFALALHPLVAQQPSPAPAPATEAAPAPAPAPPAPAPVAPAPVPVELKATPAALSLKEGDTWLFLGDSITHQCLYTQYVEDFVYTRYPKTRVRFYNSGVGGDRAQDALDRFEGDVAAQKPTYVTILLGMNDGAYRPFDPAIFDNYQKGMVTVLDRLAEIGAVAIPMTPTMFDSRADLGRPGSNPFKDTYYNGVLALYGSWLREQATDRGLGFVDMWSPLNNLTHAQRRTNTKWTMIGDAVHPGAPGQVVMAAAVLEDVLDHSSVSRITVDSQGGAPAVRAKGGTAANLQASKEAVSFDWTAAALPWVLPPEAADGYQLTQAGHHFSRESLMVSNLQPGRYDLKIDGQTVGTYDSAELGAGVELQENTKTPQYQQALKVALLNKDRNDKAVRPLRDQWGKLKTKRQALARMEAAHASDFEVQRVAFEQQMPAFQARVEELNTQARQMEEQVYQINQPLAHKYEIVVAP